MHEQNNRNPLYSKHWRALERAKMHWPSEWVSMHFLFISLLDPACIVSARVHLHIPHNLHPFSARILSVVAKKKKGGEVSKGKKKVASSRPRFAQHVGQWGYITKRSGYNDSMNYGEEEGRAMMYEERKSRESWLITRRNEFLLFALQERENKKKGVRHITAQALLSVSCVVMFSLSLSFSLCGLVCSYGRVRTWCRLVRQIGKDEGLCFCADDVSFSFLLLMPVFSDMGFSFLSCVITINFLSSSENS